MQTPNITNRENGEDILRTLQKTHHNFLFKKSSRVWFYYYIYCPGYLESSLTQSWYAHALLGRTISGNESEGKEKWDQEEGKQIKSFVN